MVVWGSRNNNNSPTQIVRPLLESTTPKKKHQKDNNTVPATEPGMFGNLKIINPHKKHTHLHKTGPIPVINGIITPINDQK